MENYTSISGSELALPQLSLCVNKGKNAPQKEISNHHIYILISKALQQFRCTPTVIHTRNGAEDQTVPTRTRN